MNPQDDESIHSTDSIGSNMMVIESCSDFTKYGTWLRKQFPNIITATGSFFVHSHLKVRNSEDIENIMEYQLEDWQSYLPNSYHILRKTIIKLIVIWTVTSGIEYDIPYTKYMEMREEMLPVLNTIFIENEASEIYSSE